MGAARPTGPVVAWSPTALTYAIAPGTSRSVPVTITALRSVEKIGVAVSPSLAGIARLSVASIKEIDKGRTQTLTLTFAPDAGAALGVVQGYVQLAATEPAVTIQLPVTLVLATGAVGALPPDPGDAGKATLAGIDSDGDGLRDDVQRFIWLTYPQSEKARSALRQYAAALRDLLPANRPASQDGEAIIGAIDCLGATFMATARDEAGATRSIAAARALKASLLNTADRIKAFASANERFGGMGFDAAPWSDRAQHCSVPPATFAN